MIISTLDTFSNRLEIGAPFKLLPTAPLRSLQKTATIGPPSFEVVPFGSIGFTERRYACSSEQTPGRYIEGRQHEVRTL